MTTNVFRRALSPWLFWLIVAMSTVVASCGEPGVGSSGTGLPEGSQIGTVTGFGSIIVDATRYETGTALVTDEADPSTPVAAQLKDVQLGMQVQVQFDETDQARSIRIMPKLIGRVQNAGANSLLVNGQNVLVPDSAIWTTIFEGFSELGQLSGAFVRVFGLINESGFIVATRIERLTNPLLTQRVVTGVVTQLTAASDFEVNGLRVRSTAQTQTAPVNAVPVVGDIVTVIASAAVVDDSIIANRIVVRAESELPGNQIRVAGLIRAVDANGDFQIGWVRVSAATAQIAGGTLADLVRGTAVRVVGTRRGRELAATSIQILQTPDISDVQITGAITDFVSLESFRVRGALVSAGDAVLVGALPANLGDGLPVSVRGRLVLGRVVADQIQVTNTGPSPLPDLSAQPRTISGQAYLISALRRQMIVNRIVVAWSDQTEIVGDISQLEGGQRVLVTGQPVVVEAGTFLNASRIELFAD